MRKIPSAISCLQPAGSETYRPPTERHRGGVTLRIDAGVYEGGEISIHYDPMIAKLATHAGDRGGAIDAQAQALDQFAIDGIRHNIPFLAAVMGHQRWRAGKLSTGFIAQEFPAGFAPLSPSKEMGHRLATVAASVDPRSVDHAMNERKRLISGQMHTSRPVSFERDRSVLLGGARYDVRLDDGDAGLLVRFEATGRAHLCASNWGPGQLVWTGAIDGEPISVQLRPILNGFALMHRGIAIEAYVYTRREAELAALMPEKTLAERLQSPALPDARRRQGDSRGGGTRCQSRASPLHA